MGYLTSSFHPGAKYPIFSLTLFLIEDMNIDGRACVLLLSCANLLTTVYNHCNMGRLALVVNDTSLPRWQDGKIYLMLHSLKIPINAIIIRYQF